MEEAIGTPKAECQSRVRDLQRGMQARGIDVAWIQQTSDLYYFSGTAQSGHLIVPVDRDPILLIRRYHPRACVETCIDDVRKISGFRQVLSLISEFSPRVIGMELDVVPAAIVFRVTKMLPNTSIQDISMDVRQMRSVKSAWEQEQIRQSAALLDRMFENLPNFIESGITELELSVRIESFFRRNGHQGYLPMRSFNGGMFFGNVLSGPNATIRGPFDGPTNGPGLYSAVPCGAGMREIQQHEPILVDMVAGVNGYLADATRIFCLGSLPQPFRELHQHCLDLQALIVELLAEDISGCEIYDSVIQEVQSLDLAGYFMGPRDDQVNFIAHGVGLEIDELPLIASRYDFPIPTGAVLAIEPKVVVPGKGSVGIENTWVVHESRVEKLLNVTDDIIELNGA